MDGLASNQLCAVANGLFSESIAILYVPVYVDLATDLNQGFGGFIF